ncbi:MAG: tRNA-guanine transglycosylase [Thermoplasmata archaeon]
MKFRIQFKDEDTLARKGILQINNKIIETPVLWLGYPIGYDPKPWKSFKINAMLVNACDILIQPQVLQSIRKKGIHKYLNYSGMIMMDSGGFLFQKKNNLDISPRTILNLYHEINPEIGVILDHPLNPSAPSYINYYRWKRTINNTIFMYQNNGTSILMPVLHGYTLRKIRNTCKEIKRIDDNPELIGLGSLVPLVFRSKSMHNFGNSMYFIVDAIKLVRNEFPKAFLHVFGIGSTTSMHLMFSLGVDSIDSIGWRLKAAYGRIQMPGIGDRYLIKHPNGRRVINKKEMKALSRCKCPICKDLSIDKQINILDNSFKKRALHNAWVFIEEQKMFKRAIDEKKSKAFINCRLKNSPFLKAYHYSQGV